MFFTKKLERGVSPRGSTFIPTPSSFQSSPFHFNKTISDRKFQDFRNLPGIVFGGHSNH